MNSTYLQFIIPYDTILKYVLLTTQIIGKIYYQLVISSHKPSQSL